MASTQTLQAAQNKDEAEWKSNDRFGLKEDNGQQQNLLENDGNVRYLPSAADGLTYDDFC